MVSVRRLIAGGQEIMDLPFVSGIETGDPPLISIRILAPRSEVIKPYGIATFSTDGLNYYYAVDQV